MSDTGAATILLVDDLPHCREWLAQAIALAFPEARIETADSVAGGLAALASRPRLALVDLGLPDGNGLRIIKALRDQLPECTAVVATVFDDDAHLFAALSAGAQGYVLKDEPLPQLAQLLRGIADGQPPLSASIARRLLRHFSGLDGAEVRSGDRHALPSHTANASMLSAAEGERLTLRETEVLKLIAKGLSAPRIGELLLISRHTVSGYLKDIYRKLRISSRAEATLEAARRGFVR